MISRERRPSVLYNNAFYTSIKVSPEVELSAKITKELRYNPHYEDQNNPTWEEIKEYAQEVSERLKLEEAEVHHDRYVY